MWLKCLSVRHKPTKVKVGEWIVGKIARELGINGFALGMRSGTPQATVKVVWLNDG